jgi:integrase
MRGITPATQRTNRYIIDRIFIPEIGQIGIGDLTTFDVDHVYMHLLSRAKPPAPTSIKRYHAVLAAALNQAVRWGWIRTNPATFATLPEISRERVSVPTSDVVHGVLRACREADPLLGMFALLAVSTGCRRGELAALRWSHLKGDTLLVSEATHFVDGEWHIKSTKTRQVRGVLLGPHILASLRHWKTRCRRVARVAGTTLKVDAFIFPGCPDGSKLINPNRLTSQFGRVADSMDPPRLELHLHSLRHFAATELVAAGISIRDVAERLGHADPMWTLIVYSHSRTDRQRDAALIADDVVTPYVC